MDPSMMNMTNMGPFNFYTDQPHPYPYPMGMQVMMPPGFPATPTSAGAIHMFPDTTVKSGSEFGDTPPSSGSSTSQRVKKFKSPEEEKRYRMKRSRNNEAAKKSRKSRKEKETTLMVQNRELNEQLGRCMKMNQLLEHEKAQLLKFNEIIVQEKAALEQQNQQLKAQLSHNACQEPYNNENINPGFEMKPSFTMFNTQ